MKIFGMPQNVDFIFMFPTQHCQASQKTATNTNIFVVVCMVQRVRYDREYARPALFGPGDRRGSENVRDCMYLPEFLHDVFII